MWDIPARASGSVVLPALTQTCTAATGEEEFTRVTTDSPFSSLYFSINLAPSGAGVAPAATADNRIPPARRAGTVFRAIILSEDG
jgi:hypothetical protein